MLNVIVGRICLAQAVNTIERRTREAGQDSKGLAGWQVPQYHENSLFVEDFQINSLQVSCGA